ncbi:MAG TPA: FlgD immunoglobulin-like domain containing protein [Verrucomicrobiae bacterium]
MCASARANVYATDIQVNGSLQDGILLPGSPVSISYILNDTATNVFVRIFSGTNVIKTFNSTNGAAGTNTGLNTIVWNGANNSGGAAPIGAYYLSITASSSGYDEWTNFTDDGTNFDVFFPTSIAVNQNSNSPYYGRVFIGNGQAGGGAAAGILKYNADGSPGDEGLFSTGGYPWGGAKFFSPWKMDVGPDDRLYAEDWSQQGVVMSFDQVISTNCVFVLRPDNYPYPDVSLSGLCVHRAGTNLQLYMVDFNTVTNQPDPGLGIISWMLDSDGVAATNDMGTVDVTLTNNSDLTLSPYAVSVDANGRIYTIQRAQNDTNLAMADSDTNPKVLCFPAAPTNGPPDTTAIWKVGADDSTLVNCFGLEVNPAASLVAAASRGYGPPGDTLQDGGLSIFQAANGDLVTNITTDTEGDTNLEFFDVAWDNVGNLYTVYGTDGFQFEGWRVYSPPGPNRATTVAVPFIQVYHSITLPRLSLPTASLGQLNFTLTGQSNVTYVIQQSTDLINWTSIATNFSPQTVQTVSVNPADTQDFYRAAAMP